MTVKELKDILNGLPDDMRVNIEYDVDDYGGTCTVHNVETLINDDECIIKQI